MSKSIKTGEKFVHNSFFMVRFKTKEGAIPFGHTLDTTRPCILFKLGLYTNISIEQDQYGYLKYQTWLVTWSNCVKYEKRYSKHLILIRLLKSRLQLTLQLFFLWFSTVNFRSCKKYIYGNVKKPTWFDIVENIQKSTVLLFHRFIKRKIFAKSNSIIFKYTIRT